MLYILFLFLSIYKLSSFQFPSILVDRSARNSIKILVMALSTTCTISCARISVSLNDKKIRKFTVSSCLNSETLNDHHPSNQIKTFPNDQAISLTKSFSNLLHLHVETPPKKKFQFVNIDLVSSLAPSSKEAIAHKWREIHGSTDWDNMLEDNFHPWLRREVLKYGEFAQATYDGFDFDSFSEYCGSCRYNKNKLFQELGLAKNGYKVTKYVYAMSHIDLPKWLEKSHFVDKWSNDSNWMGYVAVSDDEETHRIGRRDIVVAWRGTVAPSEWYEDFQRELNPIGFGGEGKVEKGFLSIYTSKSHTSRYNKSSASEQVMNEITKLVNFYKQRGEEVSLTITGHSLGGALALINAYEAAKKLPSEVPISVISFGAPRVGNSTFRDELHQLGVKTLRVVVKQDMVPKMPGLVLNEQFDRSIRSLDWVYTHVGKELKLDLRSSPYLKGGFNLVGIHSLETYLHLVDGHVGSGMEFRQEARRDISLVNKACDMLVDELRIPHCWYQMENKGLVRNSYGRWVKPKRDLEDVPSPTREEHFDIQSIQKYDGNLTLSNV